VGLRPAHQADVLGRGARGALRVDFFEAIAENHLVPGGRPRRIVEDVRAVAPLVLHGVSLNLGSADPLDLPHVDALGALARRIEAPWISEHLCWNGVRGRTSHDLLPLPHTEAALRHVAARVVRVQDRLGRRLALENVSSYVRFADDEMPEWEFLAALAEAADCGLLLDVNNVWVNACNHGFDAAAYVDAIPAARVFEIHLAGHSQDGPLRIDTHDHPVCDEVLALYARAIRRMGAVSTLLEWDDRLPPWDALEAEALRVRAVLESALRERDGRGGAPEERPPPPAPPRGARPDPERAPVPAALDAAQRRLWALLAAPEGVRAALAEEGPGAGAALEALLAGDARVPAAERLEVYANAYFHRIAGALREDHPALAAALGAPAFHDLATAYLLACPPRHASLRHAGDRLPAFLAGAEGAAPFRARWPYAAELAALERAIVDAFDAPDDEPLARAELAALAPAAWAALPLRLRASASLLGFGWPVDRLRGAAERGEPLPPEGFTPAPTRVCVYREGDAVRWLRVDADEAAFLDAARAGTTFGALCNALAARRGPDAAPARAAALLARLLPALRRDDGGA